MSSRFQYPAVRGERSVEQNMANMRSWAYQFLDSLEHEISKLEKKIQNDAGTSTGNGSDDLAVRVANNEKDAKRTEQTLTGRVSALIDRMDAVENEIADIEDRLDALEQ